MRSGAYDQRLGLAFDWREYLNGCEIGRPAARRVRPGRGRRGRDALTLDYSVRSTEACPGPGSGAHDQSALGGSHTDAADFQAVRDGAKPSYTTVRLYGNVLATVAEGWQFGARLSSQWSNDALVPGEQFGVGGATSVRGYDERELAGDSGVMASLELTGPELLPVFGVESAAQSLRAFAFADGGSVSNRLDAPCDGESARCSAAGFGIGLHYVRPGVQGRIALASALTDGVATRRGDVRAHFQLNLEF